MTLTSCVVSLVNMRSSTCRHAIGHEEYSTATCTTRVMTGPPTNVTQMLRDSLASSEGPSGHNHGCGQKGPQRIFTYGHHQIVEVEYKCLARQALKLVKELKKLGLQECFLDHDLQA